MNLDEVRQQVFELYENQEYERALEVARRAVDDFPASASYWAACLLAVTGKPEAALDTLEEGLGKGAWWPPLMLLMDPDLESVRDTTRFNDLSARSEIAWKQAFKPGPTVQIFPPTSDPSGTLLVALHGMGGYSADSFAQYWTTACDHGTVVVVPESSQPQSPEGGACWIDDAQTDRDLRTVYDQVAAAHEFDPARVVLAGFSQGARVAITRSLAATPFDSCGFIAVAPGLRPHQIDAALAEADSEVRGVLMVGADDPAVDGVRTLSTRGAQQGFDWTLHEIPDLGHDFPADFHIRLIEALHFVL